jgi:hypothetical protein
MIFLMVPVMDLISSLCRYARRRAFKVQSSRSGIPDFTTLILLGADMPPNSVLPRIRRED